MPVIRKAVRLFRPGALVEAARGHDKFMNPFVVRAFKTCIIEYVA